MPRSVYHLRARVDPGLVRRLVLSRPDEVLDLHLLELARPEGEVARRDLVAKRLADLGDAERQLAAHGVQHVAEVDEDPLRRLGPQVGQARPVAGVDRSDRGPEHQVERPRLGQIGGAAVGALELLGRDRRVDLGQPDRVPAPSAPRTRDRRAAGPCSSGSRSSDPRRSTRGPSTSRPAGSSGSRRPDPPCRRGRRRPSATRRA